MASTRHKPNLCVEILVNLLHGGIPTEGSSCNATSEIKSVARWSARSLRTSEIRRECYLVTETHLSIYGIDPISISCEVTTTTGEDPTDSRAAGQLFGYTGYRPRTAVTSFK